MSVREAIVEAEFSARAELSARAQMSADVEALPRPATPTRGAMRTAPGVRRRPRVANNRRPATAPIQVRYQQNVAAGCADQTFEFQGYRMTRWARLTVTASVLVAGLILLFSPVLESAEPALQQVTVGAGDTIWSIAEAAAPGEDLNYVVEQIIEVNQLVSVELPVGLVLQVPTSV